ncbi:MAG: FixH family protein [Hyphomicrobiaceae bacterium]
MKSIASLVRGPVEGRHVLAIIIAFFAVVFAVNGSFLYMALATYSGLVADEPYVKGLHYNDRIALDERQSRLGWQVDVSAPVSGQPLLLRFRDRSGVPLDRIEIAATIGRPSTNREDRALNFVPTADGGYAASLGQLQPGAWLLSVDANRRRQTGELDSFRLKRRLWLAP